MEDRPGHQGCHARGDANRRAGGGDEEPFAGAEAGRRTPAGGSSEHEELNVEHICTHRACRERMAEFVEQYGRQERHGPDQHDREQTAAAAGLNSQKHRQQPEGRMDLDRKPGKRE